MGNKFFKHHVDPDDPEYKLYRGLSNEVAEIFGIDFVFLKRNIENPDHILGEDPSNKFDENRLMTMYIENFQQFEGNGDLFGKFGFTIDDQLILVIGVDVFRQSSGYETPFEGDLLYHPVSEKFFEIKHVERPQGFYQFGAGQMMFRMTTVLFNYSHERFEFDSNGMIDDIDEFMNNIGNDSNTKDEADQMREEGDQILDFDESNIFGEK